MVLGDKRTSLGSPLNFPFVVAANIWSGATHGIFRSIRLVGFGHRYYSFYFGCYVAALHSERYKRLPLVLLYFLTTEQLNSLSTLGLLHSNYQHFSTTLPTLNMKFTASILALAVAMTGASAAAIEARQVGVVQAQLFTDSGCSQSSLAGDVTFTDDGTAGCRPTGST